MGPRTVSFVERFIYIMYSVPISEGPLSEVPLHTVYTQDNFT